MNVYFLLTGLINEYYVSQIINTYKYINNKIISTWKDSDPKLLELLIQNNFILVLNDKPEYECSANYILTHVKNGCIKAQSLNCDYIIQIRTDLIPNDIELFYNYCTQQINHNKFCALGWYSHDCGYILNHFLFGNIEKMLKMFHEPKVENDLRFSEKFFQETYFNMENVTFNMAKIEFKFIIKELYDNNISFKWLKYPNHPELVKHFLDEKSCIHKILY